MAPALLLIIFFSCSTTAVLPNLARYSGSGASLDLPCTEREDCRFELLSTGAGAVLVSKRIKEPCAEDIRAIKPLALVCFRTLTQAVQCCDKIVITTSNKECQLARGFATIQWFKLGHVRKLVLVLSLCHLKNSLGNHVEDSPNRKEESCFVAETPIQGVSDSADFKLESVTQDGRPASCVDLCNFQISIPLRYSSQASKGQEDMVATATEAARSIKKCHSVQKKVHKVLMEDDRSKQSKFGYSPFRRELLDYKDRQASKVGHDLFTPVTNPVTTPSTFPPAPGLVAVPSTNPVTILPTNPLIPAFTVPPANPFNIPGTFPPITIPGTNLPPPAEMPLNNPIINPPATNPVTIYPFPPPSGYPGGMIPGTVPAPSTGSAQVWCIARTGVPDATLQMAVDYACGYGADCSAIQPTGICYYPNTLRDHASYAFNSYYQRNPSPSSCDFGGSAMLVNINPSSATCAYSSSSSSMPAFTTNPSPGGSTTVFGSNNPIGTNSPIGYGGSPSSATTRNSLSLSANSSLLFTAVLLFFFI